MGLNKFMKFNYECGSFVVMTHQSLYPTKTFNLSFPSYIHKDAFELPGKFVFGKYIYFTNQKGLFK